MTQLEFVYMTQLEFEKMLDESPLVKLIREKNPGWSKWEWHDIHANDNNPLEMPVTHPTFGEWAYDELFKECERIGDKIYV